jgi:tRNA-splicing ligase RtcB
LRQEKLWAGIKGPDIFKTDNDQMISAPVISGQDLRDIGYPQGPVISLALKTVEEHFLNQSKESVLRIFDEVLHNPHSFTSDEILWPVADMLIPKPPVVAEDIFLREKPVPFTVYGEKLIDEKALEQMQIAARLPIAVAGALMPDAHPGYGLPIGGVLAVRNAVIPYGVGVDIGCRMVLSVFNLPVEGLKENEKNFLHILKNLTVFGSARDYISKDIHPILKSKVFEEIPFLKALQKTAEKQLGTSGGGNHFVEFGIVEINEPLITTDYNEVKPGRYIGLLSHSGSRGLGASVASYYTRLAMEKCKLPAEAKQLAWLNLDDPPGIEYWKAMNLAGEYASACHQVIHQKISNALKVKPIAQVETHHNFAWKEYFNNEELIVHRKGAIRADKNQPGIIPGSMSAPGYIVKGKGNADSLHSASHGAGRKMSRTQALKTLHKSETESFLHNAGIILMGGGLDESPQAYKPINEVMDMQKDLVDVIGLFHPRIVRME